MRGSVALFSADQAEVERIAAVLRAAGWHGQRIDAPPGPERMPQAVIVDMDAGGAGELLRRIRGAPRLPAVLAMGSAGQPEAVVRAMRAGAQDYRVKPVAPDALIAALDALVPEPVDDDLPRITGMIADAPAMRQAVGMACRAARASIPVLLTGASGTGKESFARLIHDHSPRAGGPFQAVNCGALPEALVESLLFGHEKGAFTGADRRQEGYFRAAKGGTIFLDEIGELPLVSQVKILRALQEREVHPVGAAHPVAIDVRVISATNRDLRREVEARRFRQDLFFRLTGIEIALPALRDRVEDIPAIAQAHAHAVARLEGREFAGFEPGVTEWLMAQEWRGNVRELQSAVHRAMVLSAEPVVPLSAFMPQDVARPDVPAAPEMPEATGPEPPRGPEAIRKLAETEAEAIADALMLCRGRISQAARQLGIGRSTLYRKMDQYGLGPMGNRIQSEKSTETG